MARLFKQAPSGTRCRRGIYRRYVALTNPYDLNRDQQVNALDIAIARDHATGFFGEGLSLMQAPMNQPSRVQAEVFSGHEAHLTWQDSSHVEVGYKISYSTDADGQFTHSRPLRAI